MDPKGAVFIQNRIQNVACYFVKSAFEEDNKMHEYFDAQMKAGKIPTAKSGQEGEGKGEMGGRGGDNKDPRPDE